VRARGAEIGPFAGKKRVPQTDFPVGRKPHLRASVAAAGMSGCAVVGGMTPIEQHQCHPRGYDLLFINKPPRVVHLSCMCGKEPLARREMVGRVSTKSKRITNNEKT
jgi:hypothetical protein